MPFSSQAVDLKKEKEALDVIADFADKFCKDVKMTGDNSAVELSLDGKATLKGLIKKIADLGFDGAAKYKTEKYEGLLRTDLLPALKDNKSCRIQIWNDLKGKLLKSSSVETGDNSSQELGVNVSVLQDKQNSWSSESETRVNYDLTRNSKQTVISPRVRYLDTLRNGGPIQPIDYTYVPFQWDFPSLDIKVVNNTKKTIFINEAIIDIGRSQLDPMPVLIIRPDSFRSNALHFPIENEGWGAASNATINFNLDPLSKDSTPKFSLPYQHSVVVGSIDESVNVDISDAFKKAGVALDQLDNLRIVGESYGANEHTVTTIDKGDNEEIQTYEEFEGKRSKILGPFSNGGALVSGSISYESLTPGEEKSVNELKFSTVVWIFNEHRGGAPMPPSYGYSTKFEVDKKSYSRRVNMSQEIKPGETDRFTLKIGVDKSSLHTFNMRLAYNGSKVIQAGSFQLGIFVPKSGADYMESKESIQKKMKVEGY